MGVINMVGHRKGFVGLLGNFSNITIFMITSKYFFIVFIGGRLSKQFCGNCKINF